MKLRLSVLALVITLALPSAANAVSGTLVTPEGTLLKFKETCTTSIQPGTGQQVLVCYDPFSEIAPLFGTYQVLRGQEAIANKAGSTVLTDLITLGTETAPGSQSSMALSGAIAVDPTDSDVAVVKYDATAQFSLGAERMVFIGDIMSGTLLNASIGYQPTSLMKSEFS